MQCSLSPRIDESGLLHLTDDQQTVGWFGFELSITTADGRDLPVRWQALRRTGDDQYAASSTAGGPVQAELRIERSPAGGGWLLTPALRGPSELRISGYGWRPAAGQRGAALGHHVQNNPVFAHTDNLRYEALPYCRPVYPFVQPVPLQPRRLNRQPDGPVPLLLLGGQDGDSWLIEAAFSQRRHLISWHIGLPPDGGRMIDSHSEFWWRGDAETVNGRLELETTLLALFHGPIDAALGWYGRELSRRYEFPIQHSRMMQQPVFCTWNYGVWFNINEQDCIRRMDVVKEIQPGSYFQIDHGYQPHLFGDTASTGMLDTYYPDAAGAWDPAMFPSGPKGFVSACRKRGLRPGIWWTPRVHPRGTIVRDHPDWFLRDAHGAIYDVGYLLLDYSVPEVRCFLEDSIATVVKTWGFEGIKLDFFTWMFDHPQARFRCGGNAVEHKAHFVQMIRRMIGREGYLLHCCSCPMGSPLAALSGFDSWRAGFDIDRGDWAMHVQSCAWLLPGALVSPGGWLTNIDSCMGSPAVPQAERRSRLAVAYLTSGMLEFSGPAEKFDEESLRDWRRMVQRYDPGEPFECPDQQAFYGPAFPRVLLRRHREGSRTRLQHGVVATVGLLNWSDEPAVAGVSLSSLGLSGSGMVRDFWSGQEQAVEQTIMRLLPPRGSCLLDFCPRD